MHQFEQGQDRMAAEQRHPPRFDREGVDHRHLAGPGPTGLTDLQSADRDPGLGREQVHLQIAVDAHAATGGVGRQSRQGAAQHVPVEQRQGQGDEGDEGEKQPRHPRQGALFRAARRGEVLRVSCGHGVIFTVAG